MKTPDSLKIDKRGFSKDCHLERWAVKQIDKTDHLFPLSPSLCLWSPEAIISILGGSLDIYLPCFSCSIPLPNCQCCDSPGLADRVNR